MSIIVDQDRVDALFEAVPEEEVEQDSSLDEEQIESEDDGLEQSDEFVDEELNSDEEEGEEEDEYQFSLETEDGELTFTSEELAEYVEKYPELERELQETRGMLSQSYPMLKTVKENPLAGSVVDWVNKGFTEQQILQHLSNYYSQNFSTKEEEKPNLSEMSEEERVDYLVNQRLQEKLAPIEQQYKTQQMQQQTQGILSHNEKVLSSALEEYGYDANSLNQQEVDALARIAPEIVGVQSPFNQHKFNEQQAKALIRVALDRKQDAPSGLPKATAKVSRQSKAPKVMPSMNQSKSGKQSYGLPKSGGSREDRLARVNELF